MYKRTVTFYKTTFGFQEPFNVLCDHSFVHYCLEHQLGSLQDSLSTLLRARAKPLVTRCVIAKLENLGKAYSKAAVAARQLDVIRCKHKSCLPPADCLITAIGERNRRQYSVAAQDLGFRRRLRETIGSAIVYAKRSSLAIEFPSYRQKEYAKIVEAGNGKMDEVGKGKGKMDEVGKGKGKMVEVGKGKGKIGEGKDGRRGEGKGG